jgi:hypothetical protein
MSNGGGSTPLYQPPQPGQPAPGLGQQLPPAPYPNQQPQPPAQPYNPSTGFRLTGRFKGSQQSIPAAPGRPTSPYDFFMNSQPRAKKSNLPFPIPKPKTAGAQITWIAGGGILLVIVIGLITLSIPKGDPKLALVTVAQAQTETLRICTLGQQEATLSKTKGFATNCSLSLLTDQRQLVAYLSKAGAGVKGTALAQGKNTTANSRLTAAKSASNYDAVFNSVMEGQLTTQTRAIQQAAGSPATTLTERSALTKYGDSTKLLLQQLKQ